MVTPFYNAVKGTTAGTPGTGAFTPNAASSQFRAWSTIPTGWIGLVRYEDGAAWELTYSYWNGTTLSRASTQVYDSSTGSQLTLTSAATAAMIVDASEVMSHLGGTPWRGWFAVSNSTTPSASGIAAPAAAGTASNPSLSTTNVLTSTVRTQLLSATTASAQAGFVSTNAQATVSTTAGLGGYEFVARFGASTLPTGPRLFAGVTSTTAAGATEAGSLLGNLAGFAKDSTDTNIQLLTNSNAGSGTKIDTGIPLVANGWYEATVWTEPGSTKVSGLLIRIDTGDIWLGSTTTDVPVSGATMFPQIIGGLNATNTGTAITMHIGSMTLRTGS